MIESISLAQVASFPSTPEVLSDLRVFNYIFGANGTGKTTLSRVIADPAFSPNCGCTWKHGRPLETLVLNRDFVDRNFDQLQGVFTLGQQQKETLEAIAATKEELDKEEASLATLKSTLEGTDGNGGKKAERARLDTDLQEKCWQQKQKYDALFQVAFTGFRNDAKKFRQKVLQEAANNTATLHPLETLAARATTVFADTPMKEVPIASIATAPLLAHEANPILSKKIIGKSDVDLAALIRRLGNSDWVRQGVPFLEVSADKCPFCQQTIPGTLRSNLAEYFDEAFEKDTQALTALVSTYAADAARLTSAIDAIIKTPRKFLAIEKLQAARALVAEHIAHNHKVLNDKRLEPSRSFAMEPLAKALKEVTSLIDSANADIANYNATIDNLKTERETLTSEVWRLVLNELSVDIKQYRRATEDVDKAIDGIQARMGDTRKRIDEKSHALRKLERQTTSIQPTITGINTILSRFGFTNFQLATSADGKHYKLVRPNGDDAAKTLSEGEQTFVVLLYFYHLLRGSTAETGITTDRVVVFDDPVSSLDSEVLFIVSSLIREVCAQVRSAQAQVKQVFVLTHNVYFHKEVTYDSRRPNEGLLNEESFWLLRKMGVSTTLERQTSNPVKTSYELLWMELRRPGQAVGCLENTMRRVLEHYFTILGGIDRDAICAKFEGQDKLICQSLFSWVNAGSHSALDDLFITPSDTTTQNAMRVFKAIFERTNQLAHFDMMMRTPAGSASTSSEPSPPTGNPDGAAVASSGT